MEQQRAISKNRTVSMVPDSDPHYREMRLESLKRERHRFWGEDALRTYENDLRWGEIERYKRAIAGLDDQIAVEEAGLIEAESEKNEVKQLALSLSLKRKKSDRNYFRRALYETCSVLHRLFSGLTGAVSIQSFGGADDPQTRFLLGQLAFMFCAPNVKEESDRYFGKGFNAADLYEKIGSPDTEVPADFLYRVLKNHHEGMRDEAEYVEKMVEDVKEEFFGLVKTEVEQGNLSLDLEAVRQRLALVTGRIVDRLDAPASETMALHSANGLIQLYSSELGEDQLEATRSLIFHELTHELAGKSIQITTRQASDDETHAIEERKTGLRMSTADGMTRRFVWLNEAITEWYALKLSKHKTTGEMARYAYKGSTIYREERKELDLLFEKGLTEKEVTDAYFEDIRSDQPGDRRGQAFAVLLRRINELKGDPLAFAKLENAFTMRYVADSLADERIISAEKMVMGRRAFLPAGTRLFPITFSVGVQERARATKTFFFTVPPDAERMETIFGADYYTKKMTDALNRAKAIHGGTRCRYAIGEPEIIA